MFWKRNKKIDLGWVEFDSQELVPPKINNKNYEDDNYEFVSKLFPQLFGSYGWILHGEEDSLRHSLRYRLQSPWWFSEIEDLVRTGLFLFDKIILEAPYPGEAEYLFNTEDFISEMYIDRHWSGASSSFVHCDFAFFQAQAIKKIIDLMGDAISNEVVLLPSFHISWDEYEEVYDEDYDAWITYGNQSDPNHVAHYLNKQGYAEERLSKCNHHKFEHLSTGMELPSQREIDVSVCEVSIPIIEGGSITDLVLLRRDEYESYMRWRQYLNEVLSHSNKTHDEISQAIDEGLAELKDRFSLLKRKGILDALSGGLIAAGAAVAFFVEGQPGVVSGTLATLSTTAAIAKALVEVKAEKREISKDDLYFLWVTRKLHDWH